MTNHMGVGGQTEAQTRLYRQGGYWADRLLVDYLDEHAARTPDKVAITDNRGTITYAQLRTRTRNLAAALAERGVVSGDVVAVQSPNWAELPIAHFALDRIGAIFLPLHDGFRREEMLQILGRSQAVAIISPAAYHDFDHRALLAALSPELPYLRHRIVLRAKPVADELGFDALCADDSWLQRGGERELAGLRPEPWQPLQVMVSSGTTSIPKCSLLCDNNMVFKLVRQYGGYAAHLSGNDIAAAIAPAGTGATGYTYPILAPLLHGGSTVLLERWNGARPEEALQLVQDHRCTYAVVIPTQLVKMVRAPGAGDYDLGSLRFITNAGAKLPDEIAEAAERIFGCVVQTVYGASDAGVPTMTSIDDPPDKRRTVGRVLEGEEVMLVRDDRSPVAPGEAGEVAWRGANSSYGYLRPPPEAGQVWDAEGWYYSGDIGTLDADGYLSIVGRKKDMIIRGGRNINPQQIEVVLAKHPKVAEAAVVAVSDDVLGEIVGAAVVPVAHGEVPSLAELNRFVLEQGLAKWCQPERLLLVEDLPRNAGGKVDKRQLSARMGKQLGTGG